MKVDTKIYKNNYIDKHTLLPKANSEQSPEPSVACVYMLHNTSPECHLGVCPNVDITILRQERVTALRGATEYAVFHSVYPTKRYIENIASPKRTRWCLDRHMF